MRIVLCVALAVITLAAAGSRGLDSRAAGQALRGDQNCDEAVDQQDAIIALEDATGVPQTPPAGCKGYTDTVCDGTIDAKDALADLLHVAGLQTLPAQPCDPILAGAGDIASCESAGDEATADLLDHIPGTVFTAGDNAYENGTAAEFGQCYDPNWGLHKERTRPVAGNHDYNTGNASAYFSYFGEAAGDPARGYYSYDLGAWHVIILNSECPQIGGCATDSPQGQWLQSDLAANTAPCAVAMWHRPVLTAGPHANDESGILPLWQLLYDGGVDLVVNGHDHNYQRYAPLNRNANGVDAAGMRLIISGTGGRNQTDIDPARAAVTPGLEVWADTPNDADGHDASYGVLKLTLHASSYDWEFVPVAGQTFTDSGTTPCH
jgi:hypothetical protein